MRFILILLAALVPLAALATDPKTLFARSNLVAWCIVPFDAKKRTPTERAKMLDQLGFKLFAYDYRAEHIPTFDDEIRALKKKNIKLFSWWFPTTLNDEAKLILGVFKRHNLQTQLWVTGSGSPTANPQEQERRIQDECSRLRPIARAAAEINCTVGLYNHGGWFGEPENQIALIKQLQQDGIKNVGIVYNQHHGHAHVDRFPDLMAKMKPYLIALNLNGMTRSQDPTKKILPINSGELDRSLLQTIIQSGWHGPIGILNHTDLDAEARLRENLHGLDQLLHQITR